MKNWDVTITEILARTVSVEAESREDAKALVKAMYDRCEIVLGAEDHSDTEIRAEHEGVCPVCGASVAYTGYNDIDDGGGLLPWNCPQCGAQGYEGYSRKFDGHYDVTEGEPR